MLPSTIFVSIGYCVLVTIVHDHMYVHSYPYTNAGRKINQHTDQKYCVHDVHSFHVSSLLLIPGWTHNAYRYHGQKQKGQLKIFLYMKAY